MQGTASTELPHSALQEMEKLPLVTAAPICCQLPMAVKLHGLSCGILLFFLINSVQFAVVVGELEQSSACLHLFVSTLFSYWAVTTTHACCWQQYAFFSL